MKFKKALFILLLFFVFAFANAGPSIAFADNSDTSFPKQTEDFSDTPEDPNAANIPIENLNSDNDIPARVLFLKLDKVEDASEYEVQIRPYNRSWAEPFKIKTSREKIRLRVTPGHYAIRTRSLDHKRLPGRWAEWKEFWVPYKTPLAVFPAHKAILSPKGNTTERIVFEWPKVPKAKGYRVKIYDSENRLFRHVVTRQSYLSVNLEVSKQYSWSLQPLAQVNEPEGYAKIPRMHFGLSEPEKDLVTVTMKLGERPKTIKYQFELVKMISEDESDEATIYEWRESEFRARLSPGEYELRVRSVYDNNSVSAWGSPHRFWVRIPPPPLKSPPVGTLVDPIDDMKNPVTFEWEPAKHAEKYKVLVFNEEGQLIHQGYSKTTSYVGEVPAEQKYTWKVIPLLPREVEREPASVQPGTESFRVDRYIRLALSDSEEPSQVFAWGRTILSSTKYLAKNHDNNNLVSQSVFASTAELAAGYWHRKTKFGALLNAGVSGINVAGKSITYNHAGLLLGYRKVFEDSKRLRFWLGPTYREMAEVQLNPYDSTVEMKKLSSWGPQMLVAYLDAFNENWGYQFYFGGYYGMTGLKTPNGLPQENAFSYQASSYITYKYNKETTGLFGYSYQVDDVSYRSTDSATKVNSIQMSGHYLSLSIIFGLQDPQK